jgi:hypothetical protein
LVLGGLVLLFSATGTIFVHDGRLLNASSAWHDHPTPETEAAWIQERDRVARETLNIRISIGVPGVVLLLGGFAREWRRRAKQRDMQAVGEAGQ